jgi:hypothetical protein
MVRRRDRPNACADEGDIWRGAELGPRTVSIEVIRAGELVLARRALLTSSVGTTASGTGEMTTITVLPRLSGSDCTRGEGVAVRRTSMVRPLRAKCLASR